MYTLYIKFIDPNFTACYTEKLAKKNATDSGFDVFIYDKSHSGDDYTFYRCVVVGTNIKACMTKDGTPTGFYITPRSSISKTNIIIQNSPGVIDAGYTGEIKLALRCIERDVVSGSMLGRVKDWRSIAQIVAPDLSPFEIVILGDKDKLPNEDMERGDGGFGSTDK